jgi:flagellar motor switch protein FliM
MAPLKGSALLAIEPGLAFSLIDCMFGGTGKPVKSIREFTHIEQGVVKKFSREMLRGLERAWGAVLPVAIASKKDETMTQFVQVISSDDIAVTVAFSISGEEFSGNIHICIPYLMLDPVKEKLSFKTLGESEGGSKRNEELLPLLDETRVAVTVELGKTMHNVNDVLTLQSGDVIKLNSGPQDPVLVRVEQVPKYQGFPGIVKGNRAVEITSILHDSRGR